MIAECQTGGARGKQVVCVLVEDIIPVPETLIEELCPPFLPALKRMLPVNAAAELGAKTTWKIMLLRGPSVTGRVGPLTVN